MMTIYSFLPISFGHGRSFKILEFGNIERIGKFEITYEGDGKWVAQPIEFNLDIVFLGDSYKKTTNDVISEFKKYIKQGMFKYSKPSLLLGEGQIETLSLDQVDFSKVCNDNNLK